MKILLTADNIGGVWTWALMLADGLRKNGIEVVLAITGNRLSEHQIKELSAFMWYAIETKLEWMDAPWDDVDRTIHWLRDLVSKTNPDILHLNSYSYADYDWDLPVVVTAHSCVLSWWEAVKGVPAPSEWDTYRKRAGSGLRKADVITAASHTMMKSVQKYYFPVSHCRVINNGTDVSKYKPGKKGNFVFSMGRLWDEAKNIRLVMDAALRSAYEFYVAGEMDYPEHAPENVHFLGMLDPESVSKWLSEAALYVLPVKYEPFGYTFLEAALSGCALVAGDIESMKEIWGDSAVYTNTEGSQSLAAIVDDLMANPEKRMELAGQAREKALYLYSSGRMTDEYIRLYFDLVRVPGKYYYKTQLL